jgi:hypothetical protein
MQSKPEALRLVFDVKLADPTTINFSDEAADNTISIKPDILLDLPLELKIKADPPSSNYAAIKLIKPDDSGETDFFGRHSETDPLVSAAVITPEEISLTLDYVNTLGVAMDLALVNGHTDFRKLIPMQSGGSGILSLNIKRSELPFPFTPGFEALIPAENYDIPGNYRYAILKIVPGGFIQISKLRIDQLSLDLTGGL